MRTYPDYQTLRKDLLSGKTTCRQRVDYHLEQIQKNKALNAFLSVYDSEARDAADRIDKKIAAGNAGALAGLVIGVKDVLSHRNHPLQASSRMLDDFIAQYDATVISRILDQDAIIIGRQNCDEFAMGSSNENSAFGTVLNPVDNSRVAGGSSGGSAAAVAADMCQASLGSDTGGSVRQPAAFCGIVGLKPTYSRVSRFGLVAYASSFDCVGVLARSPLDCADILQVIAGPDGRDSTVSAQGVPDYASEMHEAQGKKFRIAVLEGIPDHALQEEIRLSLSETVRRLENDGHEVTSFSFPLNDVILPTYYVLTTAEASSNLSRFDGVRYGHRTAQAHDLESMYKKSRSEGFGEEVKRRIMLGNFVLTSDYYDAYYEQAQRVRRMIRDGLKSILADNDMILMPVAPSTAFPQGAHPDDPVAMYLADLFSVQANVAGMPAIAFPTGKDRNGLPIGLQLMADDFHEADLMAGAMLIMGLR